VEGSGRKARVRKWAVSIWQGEQVEVAGKEGVYKGRSVCESGSVRMFRGDHVRLRVWTKGGWPLFRCV
jgi:hypothetical protein